MIEARSRFCFHLKALFDSGCGHVSNHHLQSYETVGTFLASFVDQAHAPATDEFKKTVISKGVRAVARSGALCGRVIGQRSEAQLEQTFGTVTKRGVRPDFGAAMPTV